jgi:hypothetical protein
MPSRFVLTVAFLSNAPSRTTLDQSKAKAPSGIFQPVAIGEEVS